MNIKQAKEYVKRAIQKKLPVHLWGCPGIGKSQLIKQIAEEEMREFIDLRMSLLAPTDLRGLPDKEKKNGENVMIWLIPDMLPKKGSNAIILLDELNLAPISTQHSAYQLVLDRAVGEYRLPPEVDIIAAGNESHHGAYVNDMPAPLRNRFIHIEIEPDLDAWKSWAIKNKIDERIIAFLNFKPDYLYQFDPKHHKKAFPTPRAWEFLSKTLETFNNDDELYSPTTTEFFGGIVSEGVAVEFTAFLKVFGDLPDPREVIEKGNMNVKPKKDSIDVNIAFATSLVAAVVRAKNIAKGIKNLFKYMVKHFSPEIATMTLKDFSETSVFKDNIEQIGDIIQMPEFNEFTNKFGSYILK